MVFQGSRISHVSTQKTHLLLLVFEDNETWVVCWNLKKPHGFLILEKPIVTPTNPIVKALRTRWVLFLILEKPIVTPTNPIVKALRGVKSYTYFFVMNVGQSSY